MGPHFGRSFLTEQSGLVVGIVSDILLMSGVKFALTSILLPRYTACRFPWWLERGGPTRSHLEHGSETP